MDVSLASWVKLYVFPGGRRQFCLAKVGQRAAAAGWPECETHCGEAVEHERGLRNLSRTLASQRARRVNPEPTALDPRLERTIGAIVRLAEEAVTTQ